MSDLGKAVFLSYASQDAEAAKRICESLRQAGVEVWFDQSELRGGDAWDAKIRRQIKECALFVPIISPNTNARPEGYFRLEWKLAVDRSHLLADDHPFLFPIAIGDVNDATARVPDKFRDVQWTKLRLDETPAELAKRIGRLLAGEPFVEAGRARPASSRGEDVPPRKLKGPHWIRYVWIVVGVTLALAYGLRPLWPRRREEPPRPPAAAAAPVEKLSPARELTERARALARQGSLTRVQLDTAEELCDRARQLDPSDPLVWAAAADVERLYVYPYGYDISDRRRARAQEYAARATSLGPDLLEVRVVQASVLAHAAATPALMAQAEKTFRELIATHPGDRNLVIQLAEVLREQKRFVEAASVFEEAGEYEVAGWSYFQGDELGAALAAVSRAPRTVTGLLLKASLQLYAHEDLDEAWGTIMQLQPSELTAEMPAARAIEIAYLRRDPTSMLELARGLNRDYLDSRAFTGPLGYYTGLAHELAGNAALAEADWQSALGVVESRLKAAPADRVALLWSAWLHAALGDRPTAEKIFARSQALVGNDDASLDRDSQNADLVVPLRLQDKAALLAAAESLLHRKVPFWEADHVRLRYSPAADFLRGDPRFEKLLRDYLPEGAKPLNNPRPRIQDTGAAGPPPADAKSIAVLAFANLSDDKENEYFSDGISEELLNVLAKVPGLKVTARTSSFFFKGKDVPVPEIAQKLGVAYVVEGSVRKQGDRVRITAQLIKAADGFHVWSDTFTRELKDIFAVQDEIAGLVAQQLQLKLGDAAASSRPVNPQAHQLYLQGRYFVNQFAHDSLVRAIPLLQKAVELDPTFAAGWVELAHAGGVLSGYGNTREEVDAGYTLARQAVERALVLQPDLAEAHVALAELQSSRDFDWKGAVASLRRARELAPDDFEVLRTAQRIAFSLGRIDEAIALGEKIVALDPVNPAARVDYGYALNSAGRYAEAEAQFRRIVELNPAAPWGHAGVSFTLSAAGRFDEAATEAKLEGNEWSRLIALTLAQFGQGRKKEADDTLAELMRKFADVAAYQIAEAYACRPEPDRAFEWLERAWRQRDPGLTWTRVDPFLSKIRPDARWQPFLRQLGLADDQLP
ncbi:MAG TPA: TIR domain-containing protein [Lacunisphaera sp.]|nr:TIR domain-containing protein [Lacunisphaera sp.]